MVKKNIEDMCNCLDSIPACDGQTDRHLGRRAVKTKTQMLSS